MTEQTEPSLLENVKAEIEAQRKGAKLKSFDYEIGDPIKNSSTLHPQNHASRYQTFFEIAQMLFQFRNHPQYLEYPEAEPQKLFDLFGLRSVEDRHISALGHKIRNRGIDDGGIEALAKPGILTDLVYAFRNKAATLPPFNQETINLNYSKPTSRFRDFATESETELDDATTIYDTDEISVMLYIGAAYLPCVKEDWQLGFNIVFYNPSACDTQEKMQRHYGSLLLNSGFSSDQSDVLAEKIDQYVEKSNDIRKRYNFVTALENPTDKALKLVREFAPDRYKRFSKAVSA